MLSKIVSLACVALSAGQHVSIVGSPEWQAFKNAELAHIAPSVGPLAAAGGNYAQEQLNWLAQQQAIVAAGAGRRKRQVQVVGSPEWQAYKNAELAHIAPSVGPLAAAGRNWHQEQLNYIAQQSAIVAAGAGRRKRQVQVVGSPEWQAYKNAELAHIAPSVGPLAAAGRNYAQEQLNWLAQQQAIIAAGAGRRKRQVQVEGSPEWQAYKNAELAFIAPSVGPTPVNYAQSALNFVGPAPGPTPENYAQAALNFVGPAPGPTPVNYAQSALDFVGPAPGPTPVNHAQSALDFVAPAPVSHAQATLNYQQEALNFIASGLGK